MIKDEDLMIKVSNGNLEAMSYLFEKYQTRIYNFSYRLIGNKELSEDITQEVFFNILKYKHTYDGRIFSTWIYAIARNILSKQYNKKKHLIDDIESISYKLSNTQLDFNYEVEHLEVSLRKLKFEDREVIILSKIQGIKYQELAIILNTTEGALKTRIHRAMKKLKETYFKK